MRCSLGILRLIFHYTIAYPLNYIIPLFFFLVFAVIALDFLSKLIRCKVKVDAKIIRLIPNTTDETRNIDKYIPEYSYEYKGEKYTRTAKNFAGGIQYEVGAVVKLRIDPQHPDTFIDLRRELITKRTIIVIALVALILGILLFPKINNMQ